MPESSRYSEKRPFHPPTAAIDREPSQHILVVDDDEAVRAVIIRILEGAGYSVTPAASGPEALRLWSSLGPSFGLVITDLCMPEMSGYALVAQLLDLGATIPVLVVSTQFQEHVARDDVRAAVSFLAKPFDVDDLCHRVKMLMRPVALHRVQGSND